MSNDIISFVNNPEPFTSNTLRHYIKRRHTFYNRLPRSNLEKKLHDKDKLN